MFFVSVIFQKTIRLDSGGPLLLKSSILLSELPEVAIHRRSRTFKVVANVTRYISLEFEKNLRTIIFLSTPEGLLLNIPETRLFAFMKFYTFHFSLL